MIIIIIGISIYKWSKLLFKSVWKSFFFVFVVENFINRECYFLDIFVCIIKKIGYVKNLEKNYFIGMIVWILNYILEKMYGWRFGYCDYFKKLK